MGDATGGHRRVGRGLPWRGTGDAPGSSWEGEGRQPRPATAGGGSRGRAVAVMALGVLLGAGALLLAGREQDGGDDVGAVDPQARAERTAAGTPAVRVPAGGVRA